LRDFAGTASICGEGLGHLLAQRGDGMKNSFERTEKVAFFLVFLTTLVWLAIVGGIIYVAIHFLQKVW
jgi:hypothetical protein